MLLSSSARTDSLSDPAILSKSAVMELSDGTPASDLEKQFDAAVKVIRNLPSDPTAAKDAPFQPSDELKLRFYAFFKQATEGANKTAKPAFYDIVGRYKWQAWNALGNMSRDEAMRSYVNELKKIIETMSLTQPVADFYDVLGPFYEFVFPENKVTAKANGNVVIPSSGPKNQSGTAVRVNGHVNGDTIETESDGEEFSDTYDHVSDEKSVVNGRRVSSEEIISARGEAELTPHRFASTSGSRSGSARSQPPRSSRTLSSGPSNDSALASAGSGGGSDKPGSRETVPEVNEQIAFAILRLQQSMEHVEHRLHSLEKQIRSSNTPSSSQKGSERRGERGAGWWPFDGLSPTATLFFLVWPVLTHLMIERIRNPKSGK